jgi:hypothetical protein
MGAPMIELPQGIIRHEGGIDGVPIGALVTEPNVARTCLRCGHVQCPCCNNWCDCCFEHIEGSNAECADKMTCEYDREQSPLVAALFEAQDLVFANVGGGMGITSDLRVWFSGRTPEQVEADEKLRERALVRMARIVRGRRELKMAKLIDVFKTMSAAERAAYIEGMKHAEMLAEWHAEDLRHKGKQTSERAALGAKQSIADGIATFDSINTELVKKKR